MFYQLRRRQKGKKNNFSYSIWSRHQLKPYGRKISRPLKGIF